MTTYRSKDRRDRGREVEIVSDNGERLVLRSTRTGKQSSITADNFQRHYEPSGPDAAPPAEGVRKTPEPESAQGRDSEALSILKNAAAERDALRIDLDTCHRRLSGFIARCRRLENDLASHQAMVAHWSKPSAWLRDPAFVALVFVMGALAGIVLMAVLA